MSAWNRRLASIFSTVALCLCAFPERARAEKVLAESDGWQAYTEGRIGAFLSYVRGDGLPRPTVTVNGHEIRGGGLSGPAEREIVGPNGELSQGTIEGMRVRSGFIGNTLALGVRGTFDGTTYLGYTQFWSVVEAEGQRKTRLNPPDIRQVYVKVDSFWGSVLVGKSRALFSRGATDINVMYAHRYGLGFPGNIDTWGPTSGHIGYGVLGSGFAAGIVYATPLLGGFQLTAGAFDPIVLQNGNWNRTKWLRPEGEATFEQPIGDLGKFALFGNGAWQRLYKIDPPTDGSPESTDAWGFGYGGRIELGPVRLGVAGHYGRGLGLNYALEPSDATVDPRTGLRKFDGYYVQSQVVVGEVDLSAGWGITRVFLNPADREPDPATGQIPFSVIKSQTGISAGAVWHAKPWLHLDLDAFRADARWFLGEKQVVYALNTGATLTW